MPEGNQEAEQATRRVGFAEILAGPVRRRMIAEYQAQPTANWAGVIAFLAWLIAERGRRVTRLQKAVRRTADVGRETLVVTLYPGAVLGLRRVRTRREYTVSLQSCYALAIEQDLARQKAERRKAKGGRTLVNRGLLRGGDR